MKTSAEFEARKEIQNHEPRILQNCCCVESHYTFHLQHLSYYTNIWLECAVDEAMKRQPVKVQRFGI